VWTAIKTTMRAPVLTFSFSAAADTQPKRSRSSYNYFYQLERQRMLDARKRGGALQTSGIGFTMTIAAAWQRLKALGPEHVQPYEDLALADKIRYDTEMVEWNKSQAVLALGAAAVEDSYDDDCSEGTGHDNSGTATDSDTSLAPGASDEDHTSSTVDMDMDLDLLNLMLLGPIPLDEWNLALNLDDDLFGP
jgi:HMG-box domain